MKPTTKAVRYQHNIDQAEYYDTMSRLASTNATIETKKAKQCADQAEYYRAAAIEANED